MNKRTANKVLAEVKAQFGTDEPTLYDADHEDMERGTWSIAWEGSGMDCWPMEFETKVPGVFVEARTSWSMGLYDA